jgi:outer membrane protein OmpA-like peptidoglycan-associated protein
VVDATTKNPLKAKIELHDLSANKLISTFTSDSTSGSYLFVLPSQSDYAVHANSAGYLFASLNFNVADETSEKIVNLELPPIAKNAEVTLKNIFFEFDKYELSEKSTVELEEVRNFLKVNPMLQVEIGGHSDNVGSEKYNQQLSEKRAQEVFNHLILSGIPKTQLAFKGYGSSKPVANNNSEENRALNRRISFIIL